MADVDFTVLGGSGFIGAALTASLRESGATVKAPERAPPRDYVGELAGRELGDVIYCIGLTADFRRYPVETIQAHVTLMSELVHRTRFRSFTYLSSTRLYDGCATTEESREMFRTPPARADSIYNASKLLGESICLQCAKRGRVVRLSNVYGRGAENSPNFIFDILKQARANGHVKFRSAPESSKDFVSIADILRWLPGIAARGGQQIYNLASGRNTSNQQLADALSAIGVSSEFVAGSPEIVFPRIDVSRVTEEFGAPTGDLLDDLPELVTTPEAKLQS